MHWRRLLRGRRGQAVVETALLGPMLCLLVLGSADLGRIFYYSIALTNAAREGARHGTFYDPASNTNPYDSDGGVLSAVTNEAADLSLSEPSPPVSPQHCLSGPPYPDAYYPTALNNGYVFICFSAGGVESDTATTASPGQTVRVTILYNFSPVTPLLASFAGSSIHVQATTVMVVQGQP